MVKINLKFSVNLWYNDKFAGSTKRYTMWYEILVFTLFLLAIIDLTVGVSNDAANFLNSAVGSNVASFRNILIIASAGVLAGAVGSEGMMEVARKGIFNPGFFTYDNIMLVFIAVMITDIILLDFYNSIALPTSTTVSIVFELLGSAFTIGILYSLAEGKDIIFESFLNFSTALKIISGIFLSVLIAFTSGALVQFVTRLLFTFDIKAGMKRYGSIFTGLAITSITYFLIIKGLKGSSVVSDSVRDWIQQNTVTMILVSIPAWTFITYAASKLTSVNPLKVIVLAGTFSLAMAFAGNDLVNFIGVAVAGFESTQAWKGSGVEASGYFMDVLASKAKAPIYMLLAAGVIMIITLWSSKKARNVMQTEVKLARQGDGDERFRSNVLSRSIVGFFITTNNLLVNAIGPKASAALAARFDHKKSELHKDEQASFDLLRASVNLMTASILISYATSLGLPLSTTYVSFMVAMGTSLADRAWGKESAVYRVAGVLQVIGGWVMTALIAFLASSLFALIMFYGGKIGVIGLSAIAFFTLIRSHFSFKKKVQEEADSDTVIELRSELAEQFVVHKEEVSEDLRNLDKLITLSLRSLVGSNKDILSESFKRLKVDERRVDKAYKRAFKIEESFSPRDKVVYARLQIEAHSRMSDMYKVARDLAGKCMEHVNNFGIVPRSEYLDFIIQAEDELKKYLNDVRRQIRNDRNEESGQLKEKRDVLLENWGQILEVELDHLIQDEVSTRLARLEVSIIMDLSQLIKFAEELYSVHHEFVTKNLIVQK